jgi:hypothetical protein
MAFVTEPTSYEKTAISDLQGSWANLRAAVVENFGFIDSDKLLFHIDEAMSWESVRNLELMKATFILVQNIWLLRDICGYGKTAFRSKWAPPLCRLAYPALAGRQGCMSHPCQTRVRATSRPQGLLGASACVPP